MRPLIHGKFNFILFSFIVHCSSFAGPTIVYGTVGRWFRIRLKLESWLKALEMITGSNGFLDKNFDWIGFESGFWIEQFRLSNILSIPSRLRQWATYWLSDSCRRKLHQSDLFLVGRDTTEISPSEESSCFVGVQRPIVVGAGWFFGVFRSYLQNVGIVPLAACVNYLADSTFIDLSSSSEWCSIGGRCGQRWVTFRLYPPLNESEETAMLERTMCFRAAHAVFYSIINNQSKSNGDEFQSMLIESWDEALKSNGRRRQRWTRRWHATDVGDLINATESSDGDIQRIRHWANVSAVAFDTTCFNSASLGTNDVFDDASMASFHHKLKHQSSLLIKKKAVRSAGTNPSGGDSPSSQRRHRVSFKTFSSSAAISQHFNNDILLTIQVIEFVLSLFNRLPLLSRWISVISKLVDSVNFHLLNTALVNQLTALKSKQIIRLNQNQTSPDEYVEFS